MNENVVKLLLATHNQGKIREMRSALVHPGIDLLTVETLADTEDPLELETSYEENAVLKARHYSKGDLWVLADDSGLEVFALDGRPGVLSARYGGPNLTDHARVQLLLKEMEGLQNRRARFVCVIAVVGNRETTVFKGTCNGVIGMIPKGSNGFGYDPIFIPDNYDRTFAELPDSIKNRISHRAKALSQAKKQLESMLP